MSRYPVRLLAAAIVISASCGDPDGPTPGPPAPGGDPISGAERLAWTQPNAGASDLPSYDFALYVNGQRQVMQAETCVPAAGPVLECTSPLPPLAAGRHTLEVAAVLTVDGTPIEGERSPALQVLVAGITAPADGAFVQGGALVASDGLSLSADVLAHDLLDPADLAVTPDGRAVVVERGGRLRVIDGVREQTARHDNLLEALTARDGYPGGALLSIAPDPQFASSRLLFVAFATTDRGEPVLRIARVREAAGIAGEAAIIASFPLEAPAVSAVLRFGPDGMLYAAVEGSILRLQPDGRTPRDNPRPSPQWSSGHEVPQGLAWQHDGTMWAAERSAAGDELNRIAAGAYYGPAAATAAGNAAIPPRLRLPPGIEISGLATMEGDGHPLSGDLVASALEARDLLRIAIGEDGRPRVIARFLDGRFGRIGRVASGPGGAVFAVTANAQDQGPGRDALLRITPRPSPR